MFLSNRGDTLDSRAVIRFDSIPVALCKAGRETRLHSTYVPDSVILRMIIDTVGGKVPGAVTFDLYDVNTDAADTLVGPIAELFRPDRFIVSSTFEKTALKDTIRADAAQYCHQ